MATIVITSHGTLGDNLPFVSLGQALKAKGHRVRMAIGEPMHPYALKAGLEAVFNGHAPIGQQEAQQHSQSWNHLSANKLWSHDALLYGFWLHLTQGLPCLLNACQGADLLISTPQQNAIAAIVHEKLAVPWLPASVAPSLHCWERKQAQSVQSNEKTITSEVTSSYQFDELIQKARLTLGLAEFPPEQWSRYCWCDRLLLASSPHFSQPVSSYAHAVQTGFWFYEDPEWSNWQPDRELQDFVEREPKPLVLSFSSQPLEDSRSVVEIHVRAAAKLGQRILIQQGWADFNERHLPSDIDQSQVKFIGFMPQDWLFARTAALIHHGGIGTTARALRNSCPMLVEPYGNDQFFNARQIVLLGVGAAMHPMKLTVEELARVLQEKVLTSEYKQQAETLGHKIREEQGLETACSLIEDGL
jgi:UDP:flavonoid glycosyltransferase YjiC (YdhE family)